MGNTRIYLLMHNINDKNKYENQQMQELEILIL